jgi:hypothetical protein
MSPRPKIRPIGEDVFFVFHGTRIAERGRPGTPEAMQWVALQRVERQRLAGSQGDHPLA